MLEQNTFQKELNRLAVNLSRFPTDTALANYITWLNNLLEHRDEGFLRDYLPIIEAHSSRDHSKDPFLTVITRTRGNRPEMLREALLSLAAQSDEDFELILVGHKVNEEQDAEIQAILDAQPPSLRSKIRYLTLDHGNRTTPINYGFAHAHGSYVAVLDDDDIVFDHYVETFHKAAEQGYGPLLHAYVLLQPWKTLETDHGLALYSAGAPLDPYCKPFHMVRQFEENNCPLVGIAFPTVYFQRYGMIFDEACTVREDWDYIMRLASLVGVTEIPEATAIYRSWQNAENSAAIHNAQEWDDNYAFLSERFKQMPILIPQGMEKYDHREPTPSPSLKTMVKDRLRNHLPTPLLRLYRLLRGIKGA
ncbi:MAG: glycosyltransferase family 2 protein [Oscillospiraceae bacterium]|nr:glycosyltransferase family 2 protein [Oscillospiraceae bacterium]